jgi:translation initiation factor 2 alpha subunit (eIF-2alpha)
VLLRVLKIDEETRYIEMKLNMWDENESEIYEESKMNKRRHRLIALLSEFAGDRNKSFNSISKVTEYRSNWTLN